MIFSSLFTRGKKKAGIWNSGKEMGWNPKMKWRSEKAPAVPFLNLLEFQICFKRSELL